jgi:hypothetical protein
MAYTVTSQNIHFSSWDILYNLVTESVIIWSTWRLNVSKIHSVSVVLLHGILVKDEGAQESYSHSSCAVKSG